jgi:hypothetical protein
MDVLYRYNKLVLINLSTRMSVLPVSASRSYRNIFPELSIPISEKYFKCFLWNIRHSVNAF